MGRDIATIDTPGAYLHTDTDEEVVMIIKGVLAEILVNIYLKLYKKYMFLDKGVKVLYVNLQKSIHRLLRKAILCYLKLATYLKNNVS